MKKDRETSWALKIAIAIWVIQINLIAYIMVQAVQCRRLKPLLYQQLFKNSSPNSETVLSLYHDALTSFKEAAETKIKMHISHATNPTHLCL